MPIIFTNNPFECIIKQKRKIIIDDPSKRTIFVACDLKYLNEFGYSFFQSCIQHNQNVLCVVMLHGDERINMVDICPYERRNCKFIVLHENKCHQDKSFYASLRFLSLASIIRNYEEIFVLDIDSIIRKNIEWEKDFSNSIGVFQRTPLEGTVGFEREGTNIAAGAVYVRNDEYGRRFVDVLYDGINELKSRWFGDQVALYRTIQNKDFVGSVFQIPDRYIDWNFNDGSIIWTAKGPLKKDIRFIKEQNIYSY